MRLAVLAICTALIAAPAVAQGPKITIEDDVSPASAQKCAALRAAQIGEAERTRSQADALVKAAHDAWMAYPGVDAAQAKAHAWQIAAAGSTLQKMAADACATFEIR